MLLSIQVGELAKTIASLEATNQRFDIQRKHDLRMLKDDLISKTETLNDSTNRSMAKLQQIILEKSVHEGTHERSADRGTLQEVDNEVTQQEADEEGAQWEPDRKPDNPEEFVQKVQYVRAAINNLSGAAESAQSTQKFLEALHFSDMRARHGKIQAAHAQTFGWIFQDQAPSGQSYPQIKFREWLRTQNGTFWIYGKPGSGKSTLMKYLCDDRRTKENLQVWAGTKKLGIAKFFFWNAGSVLQKSQEGLLRSILFEILRQCPELMNTIHQVVRDSEILHHTQEQWDVADLLRIYHAVVVQDIPMRFCLFIDGLDEFHEGSQTHGDLLETLRQLDYSPDIKLCLSSRPWTVFDDELRPSPSSPWNLKLEDLTREDIRKYVTDRFSEHPQFKLLDALDPGDFGLIKSVLDRAQGVFLWVFLAVRTLIEGFTHHDSLSTLQSRLDSFPPDLDSFFQHLLNSVSPPYRRQMARYFVVALETDELLPAMTYSFLDDLDEDRGIAYIRPHERMSHQDIALRQSQFRQRLDARSRGLLEVDDWRNAQTNTQLGPLVMAATFFNLKVDFIHRTARDFLLENSEVQAFFKQTLVDENIALTTCHAILVEMKAAPISQGWDKDRMLKMIDRLFFWVTKALGGAPQPLEELEKLLNAAEGVYNSKAADFSWPIHDISFVDRAKKIRLHLDGEDTASNPDATVLAKKENSEDVEHHPNVENSMEPNPIPAVSARKERFNDINLGIKMITRSVPLSQAPQGPQTLSSQASQGSHPPIKEKWFHKFKWKRNN